MLDIIKARHDLEYYTKKANESGYSGDVDYIKKFAKELMDLARKQLQPEFDKEIELAYKNQDEVVYNRGYDKGLVDARKRIVEEIDVDAIVEKVELQLIGNAPSFLTDVDKTLKAANLAELYKRGIEAVLKTIKGE